MIKKLSPKTKEKKKIIAVKRNIKPTKKKVIKKRISESIFIKPTENPIILPKPENGWESWQTFNPGVILLNNQVHFIYRAIGSDYVSRFGYAVSNDGFYINERLTYPVYEYQTNQQPSFNIFSYFSGGSWGGVEDPRLIRVNKEDVIYMIYTICSNGLSVGLTSIKIDDFLNKRWKWKTPQVISPPWQTNKNWVIFPEKINNKYAILHSINPEISIAYRDSLEFQNNEYIESYRTLENTDKSCWDRWVRGAGAPPAKTKYGWLLFYKGMEVNHFDKYKVGVMLLDIHDPTKILYRASEPILEPDKSYENDGFKSGVVYMTGAVIKDDLLLIYYGGADSYVCVAYANLEQFLEVLVRGLKPKLKIKTLKKK